LTNLKKSWHIQDKPVLLFSNKNRRSPNIIIARKFRAVVVFLHKINKYFSCFLWIMCYNNVIVGEPTFFGACCFFATLLFGNVAFGYLLVNWQYCRFDFNIYCLSATIVINIIKTFLICFKKIRYV